MNRVVILLLVVVLSEPVFAEGIFFCPNPFPTQGHQIKKVDTYESIRIKNDELKNQQEQIKDKGHESEQIDMTDFEGRNYISE